MLSPLCFIIFAHSFSHFSQKNMQKTIIIILLFLFQLNIFPQIKLIELATKDLNLIDSTFFNINSSRKIIDISKDWSVGEDVSELKAKVSLPCVFNSDETLVFQKKISISKESAKEKIFYINFLGANYFTEVLFNQVQIFKSSTANIPTLVKIPENLISTNRKNTITIKISHILDNKTTFPGNNRFLFPKSLGGFTREIFLYAVPKLHISKFQTKNSYSYKSGTGSIYFSMLIENNLPKSDSSSNYEILFDLIGKNGNITRIGQKSIRIRNGKINLNGKFELNNISPWNIDNPNYYVLKAKIISSDFVLDEYAKYVSFYNLEFTDAGIKLNGNDFQINGCVFQKEYSYSEKETEYDILFQKLKLIKNLGFNSVRFAKTVPHPYALTICEKIGLLASVEIPINSVPESFFDDDEYKVRLNQFIDDFSKVYSNYSSVAFVGIGSSFLANSNYHLKFIDEASIRLKKYFNSGIYASFIGIPQNNDKLDLLGVELYAKDAKKVFSASAKSKRYFVSEATYPNFQTNSTGYLNEFSTEAQAKYFEDLIDFSSENLAGFFINSLNNYSGNFPSLFAKYNDRNYYSIGILTNNNNDLTKNVVSSKLKGLERVIIPIGSESKDFPLFIIFTGLTLAILLGLLINSKKKFREDATRALMRPYNFFADIRDHRVLSGFHTYALMIILAGAHSLLLTNILYYFKNNILFEKILLSFGSPGIVSFFGELAWNPVKSFIYFFFITILLFVVIALIIKLMSLFLRTKVMFFNIYYVVVWSFIPLSVLLPIKLILYRLLNENIINLYIYAFLFFYLIWIFQRILKGTYVIFDVSRSKVYLVGFIVFALILGGFLFYSQLSNSTISYIILAIKQYQLL